LSFCADKSLNDLNGKVLTNRVKIHRLGRKAAFSMTGLARADALAPTSAPVWDPVRTVEDFSADKYVNYIDRHKDLVARTLENAIDIRQPKRSSSRAGTRRVPDSHLVF
jgi:hypothetical protein